jgi:hypothetical protein
MSAARRLLLRALALAALSSCGYPSFQFDATDATSSSSGGVGGEGGNGAGGSATSTSTGPTHTTTSSGSGGGDGGRGGAGGSGGAGGAGGSEPACTYDAPNDCLGAIELCTVKGDEGNDLCSADGTTSKWLKVRVEEASLLIAQLSYSVSLHSPPGMLFEVYVRRGDCGSPEQKGMGTPPSVEETWSDVIAHDDGGWVMIEVRHAMGNLCGPQAQWTLTARGHTSP